MTAVQEWHQQANENRRMWPCAWEHHQSAFGMEARSFAQQLLMRTLISGVNGAFAFQGKKKRDCCERASN